MIRSLLRQQSSTLTWTHEHSPSIASKHKIAKQNLPLKILILSIPPKHLPLSIRIIKLFPTTQPPLSRKFYSNSPNYHPPSFDIEVIHRQQTQTGSIRSPEMDLLQADEDKSIRPCYSLSTSKAINGLIAERLYPLRKNNFRTFSFQNLFLQYLGEKGTLPLPILDR